MDIIQFKNTLLLPEGKLIVAVVVTQVSSMIEMVVAVGRKDLL